MEIGYKDCWAKTDEEGRPALSLWQHSTNVRAVAHALLGTAALSQFDTDDLAQVAVLVGLHDIGKLSPGFLSKCEHWLKERGIAGDAIFWLGGLTSVADWIGSNEDYFPLDHDFSFEQAVEIATNTIGGLQLSRPQPGLHQFAECFGMDRPYELQTAVEQVATAPGLIIVEAAMGDGKTEAALWAAHRLIGDGHARGIYFALPTQVTSNRIHERLETFVGNAFKGRHEVEIIHGASWLLDKATPRAGRVRVR